MPIPNPEIIGITEKEAKLYEILINLGEQDAGRLITESGFKRPTVYKSLYSMAEKGLITELEKDGKSYFRPEAPQKLLEVAEEQYNRLDRARNDISSLLPSLVTAFTLSTERPVVTTFQGVNGLKAIYEEMIKTGAPINAALYTGEVEPELFKWLTGDFTKRRISAQIPVRSIVASGGWAEQYEKESNDALRQTRLIDSAKYPIKHEIDIFGDKVAFIDFQKGGSLIGVLINHPQIANSMRAWFESSWQNLT